MPVGIAMQCALSISSICVWRRATRCGFDLYSTVIPSPENIYFAIEHFSSVHCVRCSALPPLHHTTDLFFVCFTPAMSNTVINVKLLVAAPTGSSRLSRHSLYQQRPPSLIMNHLPLPMVNSSDEIQPNNSIVSTER